ncbi:MAG: peptidoglycan-binding protein [Alphaproteobacteria bacterium]
MLAAFLLLAPHITSAPAWAGYAAGWAAARAGDYAAAFEAWLPLARSGDIDLQYNLGALLEAGLGVDRDLAEAAHWYRRAAERRFAAAQFRLARLYSLGLGLDRDPVAAAQWYRQAAEQGHANAQHNLGVAYERGEGVPRDDVQAARWYRRAAERGLAQAQHNLGRMYYYGKGLPKNMTLALEWFTRAAEQGFAPAQNNLGFMYENGVTVARSQEKAAEWYRKAAQRGLAVAQNNLGIMYNYGYGVPKDYGQAARWYRAAAEQGDPHAQSNLGLMLANGLGVGRDLVEAYAWFELAAESGEEELAVTAVEYRGRLAARMTAIDIAKGKRQAEALAQGVAKARTQTTDRGAVPIPTPEFNSPVVTAQRFLASLDLYEGAVDGIAGPSTAEAVRTFQRRAGMKVDGRVSDDLVAALEAALQRARSEEAESRRR